MPAMPFVSSAGKLMSASTDTLIVIGFWGKLLINLHNDTMESSVTALLIFKSSFGFTVLGISFLTSLAYDLTI